MSIEALVETLLARLDLDAKARLLAGQDVWTLPAAPEIGLRPLVLSDGPVGVRGVNWTADDPSVTLPSPTALAATWDPALAERVGGLLAQEARRKGVHVLLAPTVNLHRSPLGGRHFECYSEDPLLTGHIGAGYVRGVQGGGVAATVKHFVANDSETERFTLDVRAAERTLRELYLTPFEYIVKHAKPWGIMAAYNGVNGSTMTEHDRLQNGVLRGEWGFDGLIVSDWLAARDTVRDANGGLDVAMPGPKTVFGPRLAEAVRAGDVAEETVDAMVRRVLLLAAKTGTLEGVPTSATESDVDGNALAREVAGRSFVLLRNEDNVLPLRSPRGIALIGAAATEPRILGGGSATVFADQVVSPLDGLRAALPDDVELRHAIGVDPSTTLRTASAGFAVRAVARDAAGAELATFALAEAAVKWVGQLPAGLDARELDSVEITGTFTPEASGVHTFGLVGTGTLTLTVDGRTLFDGPNIPAGTDVMTAIMNVQEQRRDVELTAGKTVDVRLSYRVPDEVGALTEGSFSWVSFGLGHALPAEDPDVAIERAVALAAESEVAVVVVGTTEAIESEGFDRESLALPGRQDELVARVAAVNPRTIVVVNAGSPVELRWREDVAAVLLVWFPGQAGGSALADVLLGLAEPGGRLPTTWPDSLADSPVTRVAPENGVLPYDEGVFIGYRAWARAGTAPAYWFGHGLGYTEWAYESVSIEGTTVRVELRNTGERTGREVVQVYVAPAIPDPERPARWLAGFASVEAGPGETVLAEVVLPERAFSVWDDGWRRAAGDHVVHVGRSYADLPLRGRFPAVP
ncbi:beta-glucosidase H [Amycolatopsis sp. H20-H5]|uniref:beta-glucosidase H n=1 Tax=Amycolatopsis sp. H20-H5 TaxID=3046309 RepID=UPI002DC045B7|nr:glycoside hydrolase family 3 C-terminal domain-containing protein [Amycolatopsis sp. H20-H5]MEC3979941.1 glycoside hydrolase family 3 C-terminal domain-containing protein [Amycolatopsis sp. H20-H5]